MISDKERLELLWSEYQYRHEHCWSLVFQTATAVTALGIAPYVSPSTARIIGKVILAAPVVGVILTVVAMWFIDRELRLLDGIRSEYRTIQSRALGISHKEPSSFRHRVLSYLGALLILAVGNAIVATVKWFPNIGSK
jgi:hypothetical protein